MTPLWRLEGRLRDQLIRDRKHAWRCEYDGDTITVHPSGIACGLAIAIGAITGEDNETIYARVWR